MVKAKKLIEIKTFQNDSILKQYLNNHPNELRTFVNENIDFDDMGFDISSEYVLCPFCNDTGFHGKVNYNENTGMHNIYCYKCSATKNNNRPYSPWDYLTRIYRIQEGNLSFLNAVISLYPSFDVFKKAYDGSNVKINKKITKINIDKQQECIDKIFNSCNGTLLDFIDELYGKCSVKNIQPYIDLYNNVQYSVANTEFEGIDQNVEIFRNSSIPIKIIKKKNIPFFKDDEQNFLYMLPTLSPNGRIVQIAFRVGNHNSDNNEPKVKKVKADFKDVNIPTMFGFHNFNGFQHNMPIALVEGEKDAIALQTIYPYTLAMGRNILGNNIKYLKYLTKNFIIIPDNDEAGLKGYENIKKDMDKYGLKLHPIFIPKESNLKDVADVYLQPEWKKLVNIFNKIKIKFNIVR